MCVLLFFAFPPRKMAGYNLISKAKVQNGLWKGGDFLCDTVHTANVQCVCIFFSEKVHIFHWIIRTEGHLLTTAKKWK